MPEENSPKKETPKASFKSEPMEVLPVSQLKILFSWKAPIRPFKKQDKEFWTTVLAIVFFAFFNTFLLKNYF